MARRSKQPGFTLIELMIVVSILGVLSAIAIPAFATYLRRAKTADAFSTLDAMFKAVSAYYNRDRTSQAAITGSALAHCTVLQADSFPGAPRDVKQPFVSSPSFSEDQGIALPTGFSYYKFTNVGGTNGCGKSAGVSHYTLTASGDLDFDGSTSLFSMVTIASGANELYKAGQVFVVNELE